MNVPQARHKIRQARELLSQAIKSLDVAAPGDVPKPAKKSASKAPKKKE